VAAVAAAVAVAVRVEVLWLALVVRAAGVAAAAAAVAGVAAAAAAGQLDAKGLAVVPKTEAACKQADIQKHSMQASRHTKRDVCSGPTPGGILHQQQRH
jgi:hypothetical protein